MISVPYLVITIISWYKFGALDSFKYCFEDNALFICHVSLYNIFNNVISAIRGETPGITHCTFTFTINNIYHWLQWNLSDSRIKIIKSFKKVLLHGEVCITGVSMERKYFRMYILHVNEYPCKMKCIHFVSITM